MDAEIRQTTKADAPAVEALLRSLPGVWQDHWRSDAVERAIASASDLSLVAIRGGNIIGFVSGHDVGFRVYLSELAVAQHEQRSGIGSMLLNRLEERAARRGCALVVADVFGPAEAFYRKHGWSSPSAVLLRHRLL